MIPIPTRACRFPLQQEQPLTQGSEDATTPGDISVEMLRPGTLGSRAFDTWVMPQKGQIAPE